MLGGAGAEFPEGNKLTPKVKLAKYCGVNRSLLDPSRRLSGCFPIEFAASLELIMPPHLYPQTLNPQCGLFSFSHPAQDHLTCQVAEMSCQGRGAWRGETLSQPLFPARSSYFLLAGLMVDGGAAADNGPEIMNISISTPYPPASAVVCSQEGRMTRAALSSAEGLPTVQPLAFS